MPEPLSILALEPYAAPSHLAFLEGLARHSRHNIEIASLPPRKWKWRMGTAALWARNEWLQRRDAGKTIHALLVSDYLNLSALGSCLPKGCALPPALLYFHENQLTYPLQHGERRDIHFALMHIYSILSAERTLFNSEYHRDSFLQAAQQLLAEVPDFDTDWVHSQLRARAGVLPLGLEAFDVERQSPAAEIRILWAHRFEYDKNPAGLLEALECVEASGLPYRLQLLGQRFRREPDEFRLLRERFGQRLDDAGFLDRGDYLQCLGRCDIALSTAEHEFFGLSTLEAIYAGALPVLPRDLAYPELLPARLNEDPLFLYPRAQGAGPSLVRAMEVIRAGERVQDRAEIRARAAGLEWSKLAPSYDAEFDDMLCK